MVLRSILVLCLCLSPILAIECPRYCECDWQQRRKTAQCVNQSIARIDVGVPRDVQVYILSHNNIQELMDNTFSIVGYRSLRVLDLSNNQISRIGIYAFNGLDQLEFLNLNNNHLTSIQPDLFWNTRRLLSLDLSSNVFEIFPNQAFILHEELRVLNLRNCSITSLPTTFFRKVHNLARLDLRDNKMVSLDSNTLEPLKNLKHFELCDKDLDANDLTNWLLTKEVKYNEQCSYVFPDRVFYIELAMVLVGIVITVAFVSRDCKISLRVLRRRRAGWPISSALGSSRKLIKTTNTQPGDTTNKQTNDNQVVNTYENLTTSNQVENTYENLTTSNQVENKYENFTTSNQVVNTDIELVGYTSDNTVTQPGLTPMIGRQPLMLTLTKPNTSPEVLEGSLRVADTLPPYYGSQPPPYERNLIISPSTVSPRTLELQLKMNLS